VLGAANVYVTLERPIINKTDYFLAERTMRFDLNMLIHEDAKEN
jgi:hypothetical protein